MLKDLQEQIKQQKKQLTNPVIKELKKVLVGFDIGIDFDIDKKYAILTAQSLSNDSKSIISFTIEDESHLFSVLSFRHLVQNGLVVGVQPIPFAIDQYTLNFIFYKLEELLESIESKDKGIKSEISLFDKGK